MAKNIYNNNSNTLLSGTSGNDTIWNGADDDATNVTIDAGAGDDSIENDGSNVTISGGNGKDTVLNDGDKVKISGDAGNDYIYNTFSDISRGDNATIDGGAGNDTIENTGENVKINGGAGNDDIENSGDKVTINGGAGNDKISLDSSAKNTVIQYAEGGGNDTIRGFNSDDTLHITKGSYSTVASGNDFIVNVDTGKIVLKNVLADKSNSISIKDSSGKVVTYNDKKVISGSVKNNTKSNVTLAGSKNADTIGNSAKKVLITGQAGNDSISNSGNNVTITGGAGKDSIFSGGGKVTINADAGNDYISNGEDFNFSNVLMNGGSGKDTIYINGEGEVSDSFAHIKNITIDGGADDDDITLEYTESASNASINGGAGDDTISNVFYYSTITGGTDDDYISLGSGASNNVIQYAEGDGNDTILGFNSDDTLQITSGSYSTVASGNDFIVNVDTGKIILKNALNDGNLISIQDSSENVVTYKDWTVWEGSIEDNAKSNVTLAGSKNTDTIGNSAVNVLITGQAGNDSIYNSRLGTDVTIDGGKGHDKISNRGDKVTINAGAGNDSISNGGVYFDEWYDKHFSGNNVTINAGSGKDTISNSGDKVIINAGAGNDSINSGGLYVDEGEMEYWGGKNVTINAGKGNDTISLGSYAENNLIQYNLGDGNDTIFGFNSDDILQIISDDYTAEASGSDVIFTVGTGTITLKDMADKEISILTLTKKTFSSSSALFAEDNLSEIVAEKSVGDFENTTEKIPAENLITFAK